MEKLLGVLLASAVLTGLAAIPFINLLYRLKFQRQREVQRDVFGELTPIVTRLHAWKVGTPNAGGVLIILVSIILSAIFYKLVPGYDLITKLHGINWVALILYLSLISFGALGFYDDIRKFFGYKLSGAWGLRLRYKLILQCLFALLIGWLLYSKMDLNSVFVPFFGNFNIGIWFILFAAFVIIATANAVNITDGLDGLVVGLSLIALSAFWVLSSATPFHDINLFIAVVVGSLLAFLYFNIYPARVWLGDTGALALGAMLATVALMVNASLVLPFIGLIFVIEVLSVLIQWYSKVARGKKFFLSAPIHHHFEARGWDETKVTMRFWLAGAVCAFLGLFVTLIGK